MNHRIEAYGKTVKLARPRGEIRLPFGISEVRGFYNCACDVSRMTTRKAGEELIELLKKETGLMIVQSEIVFPGGIENGDGLTATFTCIESGGGIDCWHKERTVLSYIDLCNVTQDNRAKLQACWKPIAYFFKAEFMYALPMMQVPIDPADLVVEG